MQKCVHETPAFNEIPRVMYIGTTGIDVRLGQIHIDSVVLIDYCKKIVNKSGPVSCGLT